MSAMVWLGSRGREESSEDSFEVVPRGGDEGGRAFFGDRRNRGRIQATGSIDGTPVRSRSRCTQGTAAPFPRHSSCLGCERIDSAPESRCRGSRFPLSGSQSGGSHGGDLRTEFRPYRGGVSIARHPRSAPRVVGARERAFHVAPRPRPGDGGNHDSARGARISLGVSYSRCDGLWIAAEAEAHRHRGSTKIGPSCRVVRR